jgi:vacuolar-type H+-ATPase subunit H
MATLDTNEGYNEAKSKISAIKTVNQTLKDDKKQSSESVNSFSEKTKSQKVQSLNDLKNQGTKQANKLKAEAKNQIEQMFELFMMTLPVGNSVDLLRDIFLKSTQALKPKITEIIIGEMISTLGCSEEQSYDSTLNQPIYIKVNQIDLFQTLKYSPDDKNAKFLYENADTGIGSLPYSMDRELYNRLQNVNVSYNTQLGGDYKGGSGQGLFDFEYVQNYPAVLPTTFGDYIKVTLKPQLNNRTSVTDFLRDYYSSVDIFNFDILTANIFNSITGNLDYGLKKSKVEVEQSSWFLKVMKRLMGICNDPTKKIDVSGNAKLSDEDFIDDSFFELTPGDSKSIDQQVENILNGVMEFESCEGVKLPINEQGVANILEDVISQNSDSGKVSAIDGGINSIVNDKIWKEKLTGNLGIPFPSLNLKLNLNMDLALSLPRVAFKSILTPKTMFGFLIMVKGIQNELSTKLDTSFDDLSGFMKTFKKFVIGVIQKITSEFVEILFKTLKKNLRLLVETILLEIIDETKNKQIKMYTSIAYALLLLGEAVVDYRNCKSVIDEILKLLNLGLKQIGIGLPNFALASASLLSGVSSIRAYSNAIKNLQKAGLPTGDAPDGLPNMMNMALMGLAKGMNQETFENGKVEVFIPPLTITPAGITTPSKGGGKFF